MPDQAQPEAAFGMDQMEKAAFAGCHDGREDEDDTGRGGRDVALHSNQWSRRKAFYQSWSMPGGLLISGLGRTLLRKALVHTEKE